VRAATPPERSRRQIVRLDASLRSASRDADADADADAACGRIATRRRCRTAARASWSPDIEP
jgi:hypothetical protein